MAKTHDASTRHAAKSRAEAGGAADETLESLRAQLTRLERENRRLRERCEGAELEAVQLERRARSVENTLSFRLGYALIHATKSFEGLLALPSELSELSREARRRSRDDQAARRTALAILRSPLITARELWDAAKEREGRGEPSIAAQKAESA